MNKILKRIKFALMLALTLPMFITSCSKDFDNSSGRCYALVTIVVDETSGDLYNFHALLDDGNKIYFSDRSSLPNYKPKNGQRAIIYYVELDQQITGYKYNVKLLNVADIYTKDVIKLNDVAADTLGNLGIDILSATISGGYLNIDFKLMHSDYRDVVHYFNVVDNQLKPTSSEDSDYVVLEFRHKSNNDEALDKISYTSACFKLGDYNPSVSGKRGIILKYTGINNKEEMRTTINK